MMIMKKKKQKQKNLLKIKINNIKKINKYNNKNCRIMIKKVKNRKKKISKRK